MITRGLGGGPSRTDDPAFQPPADPLAGRNLRAQAGVVRRDIPMVTIGTGWDVPQVRRALSDLNIGIFNTPAMLVDSIVGDSRVSAGLDSRCGGVLGREIDFVVPRKLRDSHEAKKCCRAFKAAWQTTGQEPVLHDIQTWNVMLGFGPAQVLWDTTKKQAIPHLRTWHPRYTYYHWLYRCYVAITQDNQVPILAGDGHWLLHAGHGEYRGWMRGAMRAIAPWWLTRNYALRDWSRYSERHGMPIIKAITPANGDPQMVSQFRSDLSTLGQETCVQLPAGVMPGQSYDVQLLEASDGAWQGFQQLIAACDREITLSLLAQNLTTEVKEGSFAAARVHADVRQALLEADARAYAMTIYMQVARPFAAMNFGDPDLAPRVLWSVAPYEDNLTAVQTLFQFAQSLYQLRNSGLEVADPESLAKSFGLDLGKLKNVPVLQAGGTAAGQAQEKGAEAQGKEAAKLAAKVTGCVVPMRFEALAQIKQRFAAGASEEEVWRENEALAEAFAEGLREAKRKKRRRLV